MLSSPPYTNTAKIHLHVEQLSLKTDRRLAESYITKFVKKDPHGVKEEK